MREYAKIVATFWTGETGGRLRGDPEAQVLVLYLFSCPASTMTGLYYLPLSTIHYEAGLDEETVRRCFDVCSALNVAHYDYEAGLVWVPEMARYQLGDRLLERDKRTVGVVRQLTPFRRHPFYRAFLDRYSGVYCLSDPAHPASSGRRAGQVPLHAQASIDSLVNLDTSQAPSRGFKGLPNGRREQIGKSRVAARTSEAPSSPFKDTTLTFVGSGPRKSKSQVGDYTSEAPSSREQEQEQDPLHPLILDQNRGGGGERQSSPPPPPTTLRVPARDYEPDAAVLGEAQRMGLDPEAIAAALDDLRDKCGAERHDLAWLGRTFLRFCQHVRPVGSGVAGASGSAVTPEELGLPPFAEAR